jgi:DNA-directed RNA polymerase subunit K/omega
MDDDIFEIEENIEDAEDDDEIEIEDEDDITFEKNKKTDKNITFPVMTKYEKSNIISNRIKLLDRGYKTTIPEIVKKEKLTKSFEIAMKEFEMNKFPTYIIIRDLPNGKYEEWRHEDFKYFP